MTSNTALNFLVGTIFLLVITFLGYYPQQEDFDYLFPGFIVAFVAYYFICKKPDTQKSLAIWLGMAILARFLLLFSLPNLSDDIYRFIWDGRLLHQGINPFEQLPGYYILPGNEVSGITQSLFEQLNSPEYFTVYPPVCQAIFAFSTWLFPGSISGTVVTMKTFFLFFEMGTIFLGIRLLDHFKMNRKQILWYALNPLIILELTGNLHFEALMVFFLTAAIYFYVKFGACFYADHPHHIPGHFPPFSASRPPKGVAPNPQMSSSTILPPDLRNTTEQDSEGSPARRYAMGNLLLSGVMMGMAIATKLLPLMFLPFFIKRLGWKKAMIYFTVIGITLVALFAPLFSGVFLSNIGSSIGLYFQRFEFNGSIYYLLRWLGLKISGYNLIQVLGPLLGLFVFWRITYRAFKERDWNDEGNQSVFLPSHTSILPKRQADLKEATHADRLSLQQLSTLQLFRQMLFALTLFLFCTTTVMPWYLSGLILFSVFTGHRYPLVWSFMILLTYVNYSYPVFTENLWVVGIEYLVVGIFVWWDFRLDNSSLTWNAISK